ncbi:hypothetical protein GF325_15980 [Candidatus Bathyarchaeota archaeon]|nr:hypothetical protein [Candidatus Bathyarchaeota archaeon]
MQVKENKKMVSEKKFINNLELGVSRFQDLDVKRVVSIGHNDGDGLTSSALICKTMEYLGIKPVQIIFDRSQKWEEFIGNIIHDYPRVEIIFISDLGAEERQLCDIITKFKDKFLFLLDHHKISSREQVDSYPGNAFSFNPTRFGFDGLKEIAGSTLNFMFCKRLSSRVEKLAWLPVVGMAGDVLDNPKDYRSFNLDVLEFCLSEEQGTKKEGASLSGGMALDTIKATMAHSILPFLKQVGASERAALEILENAGIDGESNVLDLDSSDIGTLEDLLKENIYGDIISIKDRDGLLQFPFEFNFLISIIGDFDPHQALAILNLKKEKREHLEHYMDFLNSLTGNLAKISGKSSMEGAYYKFFQINNAKSNQLVSDIASFTSVNRLLDASKILIISQAKMKNQDVKLSLRCTPEFVKEHHAGIGTIIEELTNKFGGRGGGHDLAGGWNLPVEKFELLLKHHEGINEAIKEVIEK